jgi:hypothetical protein
VSLTLGSWSGSMVQQATPLLGLEKPDKSGEGRFISWSGA